MSVQTVAPTVRNDTPLSDGAAEVATLPPGFRLREFRIERVLGEGGFGVVYEATDLKLERRVAIKEYMPTMLATRSQDYSVQMRSSAKLRATFGVGLRSFINEARLLARFEHPSLVKVYQFWLDRGTGYMVMPLHTAPTLKAWVRSRREPPSEAWLCEFLRGTMDALEILHREQCLHRDISPDNVLVLDSARPLLLDFGAARHVVEGTPRELTVMYKPGFAPIEQYAESAPLRQGPWTDVYSLCAVAYFAVTRRPPPASVARVVGDSHVPLRDCAAGRYADRVLAAIDAGLEVMPERRPQSIAELRERLLGGESQRAPQPDAAGSGDGPAAIDLGPTLAPTSARASSPTSWPTIALTPTSPSVRGNRPATMTSLARPTGSAPDSILALLPPLPSPPPLPPPSGEVTAPPPAAQRTAAGRQAVVAFLLGLSMSFGLAFTGLMVLARPAGAPVPGLRPVLQDIKPIKTAPATAATLVRVVGTRVEAGRGER